MPVPSGITFSSAKYRSFTLEYAAAILSGSVGSYDLDTEVFSVPLEEAVMVARKADAFSLMNSAEDGLEN